MYCDDERVLFREMAATGFYGLTADADGASVIPADLVEYAAGLWESPPEGFRTEFADYLAAVDEDQYAPLTEREDGRLAVAERSYAYRPSIARAATTGDIGTIAIR